MTSKPKSANLGGRETHTVTINKKVVVFVELTFEESLAVDAYIPTDEDGAPAGVSISKIYALSAIRSVNGMPVNACAGFTQFKQVAQMFSAMEGFALAKAFNQAFGAPETGEALKNESSDPASP